MNMDLEKRSSTGDVDHNESATNEVNQNTSEQPPEIPISSESTGQAATATGNESAAAQQPEEVDSGDSANEPATSSANGSAEALQPEQTVSGGSTKNPAAVALGRLGGLKGGKARAKSLTTKERSDAARKAALARWQKKKLTK